MAIAGRRWISPEPLRLRNERTCANFSTYCHVLDLSKMRMDASTRRNAAVTPSTHPHDSATASAAAAQSSPTRTGTDGDWISF
jgi:hypothetical protein